MTAGTAAPESLATKPTTREDRHADRGGSARDCESDAPAPRCHTQERVLDDETERDAEQEEQQQPRAGEARLPAPLEELRDRVEAAVANSFEESREVRAISARAGQVDAGRTRAQLRRRSRTTRRHGEPAACGP